MARDHTAEDAPGFSLKQRVLPAAYDVDHGKLLIVMRLRETVGLEGLAPAASGLLTRLGRGFEQLQSSDGKLGLKKMRSRRSLFARFRRVTVPAEGLEIARVVTAAARKRSDVIQLQSTLRSAFRAGIVVDLAPFPFLLSVEISPGLDEDRLNAAIYEARHSFAEVRNIDVGSP